MKCPHCNNELKYPETASIDAMKYQIAVHIATECCGKMVEIIPVFSVRVEKYEGHEENDWGSFYS